MVKCCVISHPEKCNVVRYNSILLNHFLIKMEERDKKFDDIHYSITIMNDGKVEYQGIRNVKTTGTKVSKISDNELNSLIDEFIDIYFFALKDKYEICQKENVPIVVVSVSWKNKFKQIVHDRDCKIPTELIEFEHMIEKITELNQWTGSDF